MLELKGKRYRLIEVPSCETLFNPAKLTVTTVLAIPTH
jgi:hypothetical protein